MQMHVVLLQTATLSTFRLLHWQAQAKDTTESKADNLRRVVLSITTTPTTCFFPFL